LQSTSTQIGRTPALSGLDFNFKISDLISHRWCG
jgi:hypothetical protein